MSKKNEALKLALEALEQSHPEAYRHTITAIREALAEQPAQQEPVACAAPMACSGADKCVFRTSPPTSKPWVGLTDEEVDECYYWKGRQWTTDELVRHVEAKLREKNA